MNYRGIPHTVVNGMLVPQMRRHTVGVAEEKSTQGLSVATVLTPIAGRGLGNPQRSVRVSEKDREKSLLREQEQKQKQEQKEVDDEADHIMKALTSIIKGGRQRKL